MARDFNIPPLLCVHTPWESCVSTVRYSRQSACPPGPGVPVPAWGGPLGSLLLPRCCGSLLPCVAPRVKCGARRRTQPGNANGSQESNRSLRSAVTNPLSQTCAQR